MKTDNQRLVNGVKILLDTAPLYGNIVMNLNRRADSTLKQPVGLLWQKHQWYLTFNAQLLEERLPKDDEIALLLAHVALHVIWQHPIRYQQRTAKKLVKLGTDLAVNQYLPKDMGILPGAVTLQTIFNLTGKLLAAHQDSAQYIEWLAALTNQDALPDGDQNDNHDSWQSATGHIAEATTALNEVVRQAVEDTPQSGRGNIDSEIVRQIEKVQTRKRHWQAILKAKLSQIPHRKRESWTRFNRRQPYRMDLPGQVSAQSAKIVVFIDNSASISDQLAGAFLSQIQQIAQQFDTNIDYFMFDTQVHPIHHIHDWQRHAGGGTTFQSIFNLLSERRYKPSQTLVVILTDGEGEKATVNTKFKQVYWIMPTGAHLSLVDPVGHIITLTMDEYNGA